MEEKRSSEIQVSSFSLIQPRPDTILQNLPYILRYILEYLDNNELMQCELVCTFWKDVVEKIMRHRVRIVKKKIPRLKLKKAFLQPHLLLPYLELNDRKDVTFITELVESRLLNCGTCGSTNDLVLRTLNDADAIVLRVLEGRTALCHVKPEIVVPSEKATSSTNNKILTQIAVLPSHPDIRIHRFSFSSEEIHTSVENGMKNLSELIGVSEDELKCVLWFVNGNVEKQFLMKIPLCPSAGISDCFGDSSQYRGIALSGKRVHSASFVLSGKAGSVKNIASPHTKTTFRKLKMYKINQQKCVAFVFGCYTCKCNLALTLSTFKDYFPDVPVIYNCSTKFFGLNHMPGLNSFEFMRALFLSDRYPWQIGAFLLVWFD